MDTKLVLIAACVMLVGLGYKTAGKEVTSDSIDALIERLEHVLKTQALSKKEIEDMEHDVDDETFEAINEKKTGLDKRWSNWGGGTYTGGTTTKRVRVANRKHRLSG